MNKRRFALGAALMAAAALTSVVPGCATTQEPSGMFPVDFGTRIAWNGKDRIIGEIHNNSGHAARHLRLVTDGLNSKGYVISRAYHSVDATIPAGGQAHFEAEVPSAPSYRVRVDQVEAARAP